MKAGTDKRLLGVALPIGALRGSCGVGEFADLVEFAGLCAKMGVGLIQLLPVNDTGYESSPYSALSAFALNPIYIKIGDLSEAKGFESKIAAIATKFENEKRFPYTDIARSKYELLLEIYTKNKSDIVKNDAIKKWVAENEWVKNYAVFRRLKDINKLCSWKDWKAFSKVTKSDIEKLWKDEANKEDHFFWVWLQFNLDAQFLLAKAEVAKLGILLEGDLPILINEDSADVWANPEFFDNDFSAGAPPDMYSPQGQNWGFPIYNWDALAADDYSWWKQRLACAEKYFDAYRIDHVLGFFRIWASSRANNSALLGRFIPSVPIETAELNALGFDEGRIRWLSQPHIPGGELQGDKATVCKEALEQIGSEDLWLFKSKIKGEKDIEKLKCNGKEYLVSAWNNRTFLEYKKGYFVQTWNYRTSRGWASLNSDEKNKLEGLIEEKRIQSEKKWEVEGKKLLTMLKKSSSMLPCAEDLGEVPSCVPCVLGELKILGLRVVRWTRNWADEGQHYIPFCDYPELSVCTPAVHDSSTVREWWEKEADQNLFAAFTGLPTLSRVYTPGTAWIILKHCATAASRFRVFQIQDLLHLSSDWYAEDPVSERINVPGTSNSFNWTYRLPASVSTLAKDSELIARVKELSKI
jgi:4-alpha-glucanotransferase